MAEAPEGGLRRGGYLSIILAVMGVGILMAAFVVTMALAAPYVRRGVREYAQSLDRHSVAAKPSQTAAYFPEAVPVYHSDKADKAVTVPFTFQGGGIVARVDFNGVSVPSLVDTGRRDVVTDVEPAGTFVWQPIQYSLPSGMRVPARFKELQSLKIGNYELQHAPVVVVPWNASDPGLSSPASTRMSGLNAAVGNYAFKNSVLTIDYRRQTLTVHPADFDITRLPRRRQDSLIDVTFGGDSLSYSPTFLVVKGKLEGQSVDFALDTGNCSSGIMVSPDLRAKLHGVPKGKDATHLGYLYGQAAREVTRPLHWSLGNVGGRLPGLVVPMQSDFQAIIGYDLLKDYRVTIDYVRKKVLLEPCGPGAPALRPMYGLVFPPCPPDHCCTYTDDRARGKIEAFYEPCDAKDRDVMPDTTHGSVQGAIHPTQPK